MRGLYFAKPLEYRLEIPGDVFVQGRTIDGTLSVTNRDSAPRDNLILQIGLAYGNFKELKESGSTALNVLARDILAQGFSLQPNEAREEDWQLPLAPDAPIQCKDGGPFLLYGGELETASARGQIDLPIQLSLPLEAFVTTLENHFAFEERGRRFVDGTVEVRFKPPVSYPTLEELLLALQMDGQQVALELRARGKGFKRGGEGGVTIKKTSVEKAVPVKELLLPSGQPNRPVYRTLIDNLLPRIAVRVEKKG